MQINDMIVNEYHTNNGLTKTTYRISELMKKKNDDSNPYRKNLKNQNATWPVLAADQAIIVTEGLMSLLDIVGRNVLHYLNPKVYLVTSVAYMINFNISGKFIESIIYITGALLFPIALGSSPLIRPRPAALHVHLSPREADASEEHHEDARLERNALLAGDHLQQLLAVLRDLLHILLLGTLRLPDEDLHRIESPRDGGSRLT